MKNILLYLIFFCILCVQNISAQQLIYYEDFNNNLPNGWVKTSDGWSVVPSNSSGYINSSGGNALRAFYMLGSHTIYTGPISTKDNNNISIIWAEKRPYNFDLDIEFSCSLDFSNWVTVPYEKSSGDNNWQLINKSNLIQLSDKYWDKDTVYFRWQFTSSISFFNREMFIDDIQLNGISKLVSVEDEILTTDFKLFQNYPNPFNASTIINYSVPYESDVKIKIYNSIGEILKTFSYQKAAGSYSENVTMDKFASGIYFYSIDVVTISDSRHYNTVKKMLLLK